jgi:hypothetical protein
MDGDMSDDAAEIPAVGLVGASMQALAWAIETAMPLRIRAASPEGVDTHLSDLEAMNVFFVPLV